LLFLTLTTIGCASAFQEQHFFKVVSTDHRIVNYYRVTVWGGTFLSSSRYIAGYYDQGTLDAYFNTFTQPTTFPTSAAAPAPAQAAASATTVQPLSSETGQGNHLVLLLSSNSDAIAEGLGAISQSGQVASSLGALVGGGQIKASADAADKAALGAARGDVLGALGTSVLDADKAGPASTGEDLLGVVNQLADTVGPHPAFTSYQNAQDWLLKQLGEKNP
jgi:hypothetical protein